MPSGEKRKDLLGARNAAQPTASELALAAEVEAFESFIKWMRDRGINVTTERKKKKESTSSAWLSASTVTTTIMNGLHWDFEKIFRPTAPLSPVYAAIKEFRQKAADEPLNIPVSWKNDPAPTVPSADPAAKTARLCDVVMANLFREIPLEFGHKDEKTSTIEPPAWLCFSPRGNIDSFAKSTESSDSLSAKRTIFQLLHLGTLSLAGTELMVERHLGHLQGFFSVKDMEFGSNSAIPNMLFLGIHGSQGRPDISSFVKTTLKQNGKFFLSLLYFAAEGKKEAKDVSPQLAADFHTTLNLILTLLLNRHEQDGTPFEVPKWCFLPGAVYDNHGVTLYAHSFENTKNGWRFKSICYDTLEASSLETGDIEDRARLAAKLIAAQRHACDVRDKVTELLDRDDAFPQCFYDCSTTWSQ
ncbi:hypothetical protein PLICRDRAFT_35463, partial [Plicaturopsis crispa FD-325 SS-3]